jgi:aryl-alcohol dehydrogenase-like predicted oxidoreductase
MRFVTERDLAWHRAAGLPIACYAATASGYFAGNPHSRGSYDNATSRARCERAAALAGRLGATPNQVAFAYLMSPTQPPAIPLFSTTRPDHLTEILGAAEIALTEAQATWLRDGEPT